MEDYLTCIPSAWSPGSHLQEAVRSRSGRRNAILGLHVRKGTWKRIPYSITLCEANVRNEESELYTLPLQDISPKVPYHREGAHVEYHDAMNTLFYYAQCSVRHTAIFWANTSRLVKASLYICKYEVASKKMEIAPFGDFAYHYRCKGPQPRSACSQGAKSSILS